MCTAPRLVVIIPCYNEAAAIAKVVRDFRAALPDAEIIVYDNNSHDETAKLASAAGASVYRERLQGKGFVVRRMFADVEADVYILVDGDDTYEAGSAPAMVAKLLAERLDVINCRRIETDQGNYRRGHRFGNRLLSGIVCRLFGDGFDDMLSGYKVLSRRFAKSFPALSGGFELETELAIHALEMNMPVAEVDTPYRNRPAGSESKLNTISDGLRIASTILRLLKEARPFAFFLAIARAFASRATLLALPLVSEYLETGLVPRFPTAILVTGMMIVSFLSLACGVLLDSVARSRRQLQRLHYLRIPLWRPNARSQAPVVNQQAIAKSLSGDGSQ